MKKFLLIIYAVILFAMPLSACTPKDGDYTSVEVSEVTHSIFYAPFYVAIENGFFEKEGLKINLSAGSGSNTSMTTLLSGGCDIALLGPETCVYVALEGKKDLPIVFAQLTKRDGSFLMSRKPEPSFSWGNLKNKYVIAGRTGGMPAMTFKYVVNNFGLKEGVDVTLDNNVQFNLMGPTFDGGLGDYVTLFEPTASEYQNEGKGYIVASVGKDSGEVPYTCFATMSKFIDKHSGIVEKFTLAMHKAIKYMREANLLEVAESIKGQFPSTSVSAIKTALTSYLEIDAWMTKMSMTKESFNRLQDIMENAGELSERVEFEKIIDNSYSDKTYDIVFG